MILPSLLASLVAHTGGLECDTAIVGAGPGGLYTALRLLNTTGNASVCLLEGLDRVGGRVHTLRGLGPQNDLNVDLGAYRFARQLTSDNQDTTCV